MYTRHSSRPQRAAKRSFQKSPSPDEDVVQRRVRSRRQRRTEATEVDTGRRDIIDIINDTQDGLKTVEIADEGLDHSDEDSVASGPSIFHHTTASDGTRQQDLCPACRRLFHRAKRMKAPIKNKLLDNSEQSFSVCARRLQ